MSSNPSPDPPLLIHLEQHLGGGEQAESAKAVQPPDYPRKFHILRFTDSPNRGDVTYVTFGFSFAPTHKSDGSHIRVELLVALRHEEFEWQGGALLANVAEKYFTRERALLLGDVVGPAGPVAEGSKLECLVGFVPGVYGDNFGYIPNGPANEPVWVIWLLPVSQDEATFVREHGREAFEDLVVEHQPELLDWCRTPLLRVTDSETCPTCGQQHRAYEFLDGKAVPVSDHR